MTASKFVDLRRRAMWFDRITPPASHATKRRVPVLGQRLLFLAYAAGIAGLLQDSWQGLDGRPWMDFHILFGLSLWVMVLVQFSERPRPACPTHDVGLRAFRRHLARVVYLLLYVLFGLNQLFRAGASLWIHGALHTTIAQPVENLRDYLAYGVLALLTIHLLAIRESRRPSAPQMNPP